MSRTRQFWRVAGRMVAAWLIALIVLGPDRATAGYEGANGRIALVDVSGGNTDIYTIRPDGTGRRRLTTAPGLDTEPAYSADGRRIAFVRGVARADLATELWVMRADGSSQRRILADADGVSCPDFSPDGGQVAFGRLGAMSSARQGLWIVTLASGVEKRLAPPTPGFEDCPVWSPDGRTLAFTRSTGSEVDGSRLWTMRANGTQRHQLTAMRLTSHESDLAPDWSPNGRSLLFTRNVDGDTEYWSNLWTIRADGSGLKQLTRTDAPGGFTGAALYSPDGTRLAGYCKKPIEAPLTARSTGIYTLRSDGSRPHRILTSNTARVYSWQSLPVGS